jgi:hypothetical protein
MSISRFAIAIGILLTSLCVTPAIDGAEKNADQFHLIVDAAHTWLPPFGLDRVGRPLTVEVESSAKIRPSVELFLAAYQDGKTVARQKVDLSKAAPFIGRVVFQNWPEEIALLRRATGGDVEIARHKIDVPLLEADAAAEPDAPVNPVDLGAIFVPADYLLLEAGQGGRVDVAAISRNRDLPNLTLDVWFQSEPEKKASATLSLDKGLRKQIDLPFPKCPISPTRDTLCLSISQGTKQLWQKAIPTMIVQARPAWPRFGASRTKLRYDPPILIRREDGSFDSLPYEDGWDRELDDVVVSLPGGTRFVFWRGSSYVPFWAGTHNTAFTYEWAETRPPADGFVDSVEPLMDKELRYGRVEIVESTEARVHVRWRYQSCDFTYKVWGDWAVEDFYFYPDGFGTRVVTLTSTPGREYELLEFIVLTSRSTYPFSVLPANLVDVLFLDGPKRSLQFPFLEPADSENLKPRDVPALWRIRLHKDEQKAAISFSPRETHQPHGVYRAFSDRHQLVTPVYWGSHWPLARGKTTGRGIDDGIHKTPAHNSIMTWAYDRRPRPLESRTEDMVDTLGKKRSMHVGRYAWLIGMTDDSDERLLKRALSYARPAAISVTGGEYQGWKADRRAHRIRVTDSTVTIQITPQTACINPVFELAGANRKLGQVVSNGRILTAEEYAWDGQTLWLAGDIVGATTLRVTWKGR